MEIGPLYLRPGSEACRARCGFRLVDVALPAFVVGDNQRSEPAQPPNSPFATLLSVVDFRGPLCPKSAFARAPACTQVPPRCLCGMCSGGDSDHWHDLQMRSHLLKLARWV